MTPPTTQEQWRRPERAGAEPATIVVFGGTGDLMKRKLLPALYHLVARGLLDERSDIVAAARSKEYDDERYRRLAEEALGAAGVAANDATRRWSKERVFFHSIGAGAVDDFRSLSQRLGALEQARGRPANRVFYLALPPQSFPGTIAGFGASGLNRSAGWTRLVIEKPFGHDLPSSRELNTLLHEHFDESQIYRIDHYLGKETVQNLLVFRFANPIFETLWNRDRVAHVQITVAEQVGVEGRAAYYDEAGALRDIVQNHLTQLLTLVAMEVPGALDADQIRNEKVKVFRAIRPVGAADVVYGQYTSGTIHGGGVPAYRDEPGVPAQSTIDTFTALRLEVANWRWHGVPFYVRAGKRLARRLTQVVVTFREPPVSLFPGLRGTHAITPNALIITIQPDEGFDLRFQVKAPGQAIDLQSQRLQFRYAEAFEPLPDAYETLLLDVVRGDQTLFVRSDEVEAAWALYAPILERRPPVTFYPAGTWGPAEADRLLADGARWFPS
jgi:glucose-6-phosphate 1-dehydrogenase